MDEGRQNDYEFTKNFFSTISRFIVGYNKGIVLGTITTRSMAIIESNLQFIRDSMETVVTAFEEIRATSQSTTQNSLVISQMMNQVLDKNSTVNESINRRVEEIRKATEDAHEINRLFLDFAEKSRDIQEIIGAIQDVSDRTNILAINASIEAARAGEVGKGFRIIANEVRNLATQTGDFAKKIDSTIVEFGESVKTITSQMNNFLELLDNFQKDFKEIMNAFNENNKSINETGNNLNMISDAIKEQNTALEDGIESLEQVFSSSQDTEAVISSLKKSHSALDKLLGKGY